jgi:hypothetical protein
MTDKKPARIETLRVRVTPHERAKLERYAAKHNRTMSQVIREYIRRLPNAKGELSSLDGYEAINESSQNEGEQEGYGTAR